METIPHPENSLEKTVRRIITAAGKNFPHAAQKPHITDKQAYQLYLHKPNEITYTPGDAPTLWRQISSMVGIMPDLTRQEHIRHC